ncbi:hypothetical protein PAL_GLEAN10023948 [Pteropus alecto]|uniref:Uncharacterized protein n=1 Tax=Pteropus alecto TaxID=9402 RepID=L5K782_PTEAL|nr:hypothetical protein PAL_GLEAN10023948 [Pteropus alecto]
MSLIIISYLAICSLLLTVLKNVPDFYVSTAETPNYTHSACRNTYQGFNGWDRGGVAV